MESFDFPTIITKFDKILERGLCRGIGYRNAQMCIEAAICAALDLPHGDNPGCVSVRVREFKIRLNDSNWSSAEARAKGLRDLGIAQIGSKIVVEGREFSERLTKRAIRVLFPTICRDWFPDHDEILAVALRCETEGTIAAITAVLTFLGNTERHVDIRRIANYILEAAYHGNTDKIARAADVATMGAPVSVARDRYLTLVASLTLDVLKELKSPGCAWI